MFASSLTLYSRLTYRMYRNTKLAQRARSRRRTLVIGAGDAASTLLHEVFKSNNRDIDVYKRQVSGSGIRWWRLFGSGI